MRSTLLLILALALCAAAVARQPDGTLGIIQTPNEGRPAIVAPGEGFTAKLTEEAALRLVGEAEIVLEPVEWVPLPCGHVLARCIVPEDTPPGAYGLRAETGPAADDVVRAVFIRDRFPESYTIAHIAMPQVDEDDAPGGFKALISEVNEAKPAFALVTGSLTAVGSPEAFFAFVAALSECRVPTFVTKGPADGPLYEAFFGSSDYAFRFGMDGYLAIDTSDWRPVRGLATQVAKLQILRREIKAARWSVGFTSRYTPAMGVRAQIVLFIDNPLDHLLFGSDTPEAYANLEAVPAGSKQTPVSVVPPGVAFFGIGPGGLVGETQTGENAIVEDNVSQGD